jgi:hypothetical protein
MKAADYGARTPSVAAFVSTNSICQGQQVPILWPMIFSCGHEIAFAHTSFKWTNLASHNAGVIVAIIGITNSIPKTRKLFSTNDDGATIVKDVPYINAYLVSGSNVVVEKLSKPPRGRAEMLRGNMPYDGGNLLMSKEDVASLKLSTEQNKKFIRKIYGSAELIRGLNRYCLWIDDAHLDEAMKIPSIAARVEGVRVMRLASTDKSAREMAKRSHQMREMNAGNVHSLIVPIHSSENREYLPVGCIPGGETAFNAAFALYDADLWNLALIASKIHLVWIGTVCGKIKSDFRYSNTMGWNTFPIPVLTEQNKLDLTASAHAILLAREAHFPASIADLYEPENMPENLRIAHNSNDEVIERIYIGRRFKNDTERLEKLFELYTKMTVSGSKKGKKNG